jgi:hypothetical protein
MSYPVFQVPAGDVLPIFFSTYAGATGASITATGLAVTDIEIYKDGSVTQRSSDAGYTLLDTDGLDFDGITGVHGFSIDTGDNTDASFYTVGAWFTVVVSAVTVDTQTVSFIAAQFRIMPAESVAGKPKVDVDAWLGTAAATPTVAGVPEVDVTHWGGSASTAITTNITGSLSGAVGSVTASVNVGQIAGQTANAAGAVTFPSTLASTTNITAGTITTVTNLTNAPTAGDLTATMKASVNAEVLDVLNTDTFAEPGQEAPGATVSLVKKIGYLYKAWRNRSTQTSATYSLYADDATTVDQKATVADDGTTFSRTEIATGP